MAVYHALTKYLPDIEKDSLGEWIVDRTSKGTGEDPFQMPYASYSRVACQIEEAVYEFMDTHPEYGLENYQDILAANHIQWEKRSMQEADVSAVDGTCVMALLMGAVRADRFTEGALLSFFSGGSITKWLLRLQEIDDKKSAPANKD